MAKLLEWIGNGIACLCLLPFLIALSLADRFGKKKDRTAPEASADASRPEYGEERPTLPPPVIEHLSQAEREEGRALHDKDFEERRYRWAAKMEAEELIREVGGF